MERRFLKQTYRLEEEVNRLLGLGWQITPGSWQVIPSGSDRPDHNCIEVFKPDPTPEDATPAERVAALEKVVVDTEGKYGRTKKAWQSSYDKAKAEGRMGGGDFQLGSKYVAIGKALNKANESLALAKVDADFTAAIKAGKA